MNSITVVDNAEKNTKLQSPGYAFSPAMIPPVIYFTIVSKKSGLLEISMITYG